MNPFKKLAGQTAIYGMSSIIGRFLNYLLVPLYTSQFLPAAYGVVTEFYAYVAFFAVLLTYGMETALFRFVHKDNAHPAVYSTTLISVLFSSAIFVGAMLLFADPVANALEYPQHKEYIVWFAIILGLDAVTAIPFAKLRAEGKALWFAVVKLLNIGINIGLNLFFILFAKQAFESGEAGWLASMYDPSVGVGYIFIANLVASAATALVLLPQLFKLKGGFDGKLWKEMLVYAAPLILVGFAGIINEAMDRALLKYLLPYDNETNLKMLGIYGACYKLAMLMSLFIQAYRYAAEPFFFAHAQKADAKKLYARVLNYFTIAGCLIFLIVALYLDVFKHFIPNEAYYSGLHVVPVLLLANLFLGLYVNLSIWYKLTDRTGLGAMVSVGGALLTLVLNIWWIPIFGYTGSAWATLACYAAMAIASYFLGQKYYPVNYNIKGIGFYIALAIGMYWAAKHTISLVGFKEDPAAIFIDTMFLLLFIGVILVVEKSPVSEGSERPPV